MGFISHSCCICRGDTEMIRIEDFNKAVEFIQKKAEECGIEIVQVDGSSSFTFYGKSRGCVTPVYAQINTENAAIMLAQPLVEESSFFNICADGTVVQISERDYDGDYYNYDDYDDDDDYDDYDDIYYDDYYNYDDYDDDEDEW